VTAVVDTTHRFSPNDVSLGAGYGSIGLCAGGSFPSGHGTTVYEAGFTLATLLPSWRRKSSCGSADAGNNRMVLGVHYPTDVMGGRMTGEAALAARWSDKKYRTEVLAPAAGARHLPEEALWAEPGEVHRRQKAYTSNPYGGKKMPGGTAQVVTNRKSAVKVYRELMTYGYPLTGKKAPARLGARRCRRLALVDLPDPDHGPARAASWPKPRSSRATRWTGGTKGKSWQRLDLAAAMSATVKRTSHGKVKVVSTGGQARVL
jgi:hypothetical protein